MRQNNSKGVCIKGIRGLMGVTVGMDETNYQQQTCHQRCTDTTKHIGRNQHKQPAKFFPRIKMQQESTEFHMWRKFKSRTQECIPRNNSTDDRMDTTTMTQQLTASDRLGHTWTFNIPLLAVGLSGGQIVVNNPPTLSWHVKEGREGGKTDIDKKKMVGL